VSPAQAQRLIRFLLLVVGMSFVAFPLYWMILTALTPRDALVRPPFPLARLDLTLANVAELLAATEFLAYLANSLIVAAATVVLNVIAATLAGYGLSRFTFVGKQPFARGALFSYMFPPLLLAIPLYIIFAGLGLRNSLTGLVLAHVSISLPLNIWIMWQYFQIVPLSLEEAAWTSGASKLRALHEICLPSAVPGIVSVAIFAFALSWNDFAFAFILQTDTRLYTLPVGLATFVERTDVTWGMMMAASALISIPTFALVFLLQRYLVGGLGIAGR
jgi:multiple sugar transport system permease protein